MASPWAATQIYALGEQVTYASATWTSTQNYNYNRAPVVGSDWWSGGGGGGGGVTGLAVDSSFPGALRLATTAGGPPILPGALTAGNLYVGATATNVVGVDSSFDGNVLQISATDGGAPIAPGTLVPSGFFAVPVGFTNDIVGGDFSLPSPPAAGTSASSIVTAIPASFIVPGAAYLITYEVNFVNADVTGTPHPVQFDTGTDCVQVSVSGACIAPADSVDFNTHAAFINRTATLPQTFDGYSGTLLVQTQSSPTPASDIDIKVELFNRSGQMDYGGFSSFGAQVCPLVLRQPS